MNARNRVAQRPDVKAGADPRRIGIGCVGIRNTRHPVRGEEPGGGVRHTVAAFGRFVGLPRRFDARHMSRVVEILGARGRESGAGTFRGMVGETAARQGDDGRIEGFRVAAENLEAIRNRSACTMIARVPARRS